jgi:hypothetical protein
LTSLTLPLRRACLALWTAALLPLCVASMAQTEPPFRTEPSDPPEASDSAPLPSPEDLNTSIPAYLAAWTSKRSNAPTSEDFNAPFPWLLNEEDDLVVSLADFEPQTAKPAVPPTAPGPFTPSRSGVVRVEQFKHMEKQGNGDIKATGGVVAIYTDDQTQQQTTVTAQEFDYVAATGQAQARGSVRLENKDVIFTGQDLNYNFQTQTGTITNGIGVGDYFTLRGQLIKAQGDGSYVVEHGEYTTCIRARPDYKIRARQLIIKPGDYVVAHGLILYMGGTRVISWPRYKINLKHSHAVPVPLPGYDKTDGPFVRLHDRPIEEANHSVDYDVRVGALRLPIGLVGYVTDIVRPLYNSPPPHIYLNTLVDPLRGILEQLNSPTYTEYAENSFREQVLPRSTFDAVFQNNLGVYNRQRTDLSLTRGEIALRFINMLAKRAQTPDLQAAENQNPQDRVLGNTQAVLARVPNAPFLLDSNFVLSEIHEMPTDVTAGRLAFHASLASQPLIIGRRISLRAGLSNWFHLYTTGTAHDLTSPEIALDYVPTRTSRIGVAYRYVSTTGRTPFAFDARDIRNEVRLQYQVSGPWAFGVVSKIDVDRGRSYDTEFAVLRNFDCMQVGINYRARSQSFNIIFNLLPPTPDRARRRLLPLNPNPNPGISMNGTPAQTALNPNAVTNLGFGDEE